MIPRPALEAAVERLRIAYTWWDFRTQRAIYRVGARLIVRHIAAKLRALEARLKEM